MDISTESAPMESADGSDLTADLAAAFQEYDKVAESEDSVNENEVTAELSEETADEVTEDTVEEVLEALCAPEHWSSEHKELFDKLGLGEIQGRDAQQFLIDRHKSMEGDYTRKMQDMSDFRHSWEPVEKMYAPYIQQLQQAGLTPQQHIERLANADRLLNQDPISGIQHVAQMYGIDLSQFAGEQAEISPEVQALHKELADLRGQIQTREQQQWQERHNTVVNEIEQFAEAKNENDELAHPYFNDVIDDMMLLAQAERARGREPNLQDLYDKAVWSNTSVREQVQKAQQDAAEKKAQEEARAKAAKAKKAARSVTGNPSGQTPSDELSLREQLERQLA